MNPASLAAPLGGGFQTAAGFRRGSRARQGRPPATGAVGEACLACGAEAFQPGGHRNSTISVIFHSPANRFRRYFTTPARPRVQTSAAPSTR